MDALIAILARRPWVAAGAFVVLGIAAVHGRALTFPFAWDDGALVAESPLIAAPEGLGAALAAALESDFWGGSAQPYASGMYRPAVIATYLLERAAFGPSPVGPHALNLLLHLGVALLLLLLARRLGAGPLPAALAAGLFALHPVVVMPAVNVTSRTDPLAALFLLLALHAALGLRRAPLAALGAAAGLLLALLSKESAVAGGAALGLLALLPAGTPGLPERSRGERALLLAALALATALYLALRWRALGSLWPEAPAYTEAALAPGGPLAFLAGPELTLRYAVLALVPVGLSVVHPLPEPGPLLGGAALALLLAAGALLWRRDARRGLLALGWFVLALLPVTGWLAAPARFTQLYLYLPLLGVAALGAVWLRSRRALAVAAVLLGPFVLGSVSRVAVWSSGLALWQDAAAANPADPSVQLNLGNALLEAGREGEAREALTFALEQALEQNRRGTAAKAALSLGNQARKAGALPLARGFLAEAARLSEDKLGAALINLSLVTADLGDLRAAEDAARRAITTLPGDARAHVALGVALARQARFAEARAPFEAALRLDPANADAKRSLQRLDQVEANGG
ncbi:MAG: tetratricopeptide repeat protein [Deltaproteobacteria bacterium]|nr:tetratricopeptide repeat protein [Deltaproteobacteria bacterium]